MNAAQANVAPIRCTLSDLTAFTTHSGVAHSGAASSSNTPDAICKDTILKADQPFSLRVLVEFSESGAIALMPLSPTLTVTFYAKPVPSEPGMTLGESRLEAIANLFTYTPTLSLASPEAIGLKSGSIYRINAVLRVGAPDCPALIVGIIEGLTIQIYCLPQAPGKLKKADKANILGN